MKTKLSLMLAIFLFVIFNLFKCSPETKEKTVYSSDNPVIQIGNGGNGPIGNLNLKMYEETAKSSPSLNDIVTRTAVPDIDMARTIFKIRATCASGALLSLR